MGLERKGGLELDREVPSDLLRAASWKKSDGARGCGVLGWDRLDKRMADVLNGKQCVGKTSGFKGENRKQLIQGFFHKGNSFFSPSPDGRANIVDLFSGKFLFF